MSDKRPVIYMPLQGRIGNQLFNYAMAKQIKKQYSPDARIILDDAWVLKLNWFNALPFYNLPDVEYAHNMKFEDFPEIEYLYFMRRLFTHFARKKNYPDRYAFEKKWQPLLNKQGLILCDNGYLPYTISPHKPIYAEGFFQSEKYFKDCKVEILHDLRHEQFAQEIEKYRAIDEIRNSNTVCISVKVEHNVGSNMYAVCGLEYWKKAIVYISEHVDNPFFMICSDNVPYVLENLIDSRKYTYAVQDSNAPVHVSLAVMGLCKHFIIGNTTFGWWAQYLSNNENKIVIAPSKWMHVDMPIDIYQDNWTLIDVG